MWVVDSLAFFLSWMNLLKFSIGFPSIGPLVLILLKMMLHDVPKFTVLAVILIIAFSGVVSLLIQGTIANMPNMVGVQFENITLEEIDTILFQDRLQLMALNFLGAEDLDFDQVSRFIGVGGVITMSLFVVVLVIAFLNMLIAAMAYTFASIYEDSETTFKILRAKSILEMDEVMCLQGVGWVETDRITSFPSDAEIVAAMRTQ